MEIACYMMREALEFRIHEELLKAMVGLAFNVVEE